MQSDRDAAARKGLDAAASQRPAAFFTKSGRQLVSIGNFEDDLQRIAECDWIIEAVVEDLGVKRDIWSRVETFLKPSAILSTNTSGISIERLCESFSPDIRKRLQEWSFCHFPEVWTDPFRIFHLYHLLRQITTGSWGHSQLIHVVQRLSLSPR